MQAKLFEILDRATFIPVLAVRCNPANEAERYLLGRTGYGRTAEVQADYVAVVHLAYLGRHEGHLHWGEWPNDTMRRAHRHVADKWDDLEPGTVIDCEFLRGELEAPKESERVCEGGNVL
jgi:hypothetical protein